MIRRFKIQSIKIDLKSIWIAKHIFFIILIFVTNLLSQSENLDSNFKDPPLEYSMFPFWAWNGTLEPDKLIWQMQQMLEKGIYGAFIHARSGIDSSETPYFSEGWWKAIEATVKYANKIGFTTCLYDEDKWPSGSAGGRTVAANPQAFAKKGLRYKKWEITGPRTLNIDFAGDIVAVMAAKIVSEATIDPKTIVDISKYLGKEWNVPEGKWTIIAFEQIRDENQIDYLDRDAVGKFIEITHEEYFKRVGEFFGNTIPAIFFDEIYANMRGADLAWTDDFLEKFYGMKGYDLKKYLPLLILNGGSETIKIRCDYFDVFTTLYCEAWFKQYADWCEQHNIWMTGHTLEFYNSYMSQGSYFRTWAYPQVPGTDNEYFRYGFPRRIHWYKPKQLSSVAHINGRRRAAVEAMGGGGWIIPLEEYRYGTAMLAAYGINMFIPHLFHYAIDAPYKMDDWPPSWFYRNPYWKYFKSLADFTRRVSYLCSQGHHVCDVAILHPISSQWASGIINEESEFDDRLGIQYNNLQDILLENLYDYDIIDPESLIRADLHNGKLSIANETYSVLILPPLMVIRRQVAEKIKNFVKHGGKVVALTTIPYSSVEIGENDPIVIKNLKEVFGFDPRKIRKRYFEINESHEHYFISHPHTKDGKAYFTKWVRTVPQLLSEFIIGNVTVSDKCKTGLRVLHRQAANQSIYFLVNEQKVHRTWRVSFKENGNPELWHPETGVITKIENYMTCRNRIDIPLNFNPWEAYFIVFDTKKVKPGNVLIIDTDLREARIEKIDDDKIRIEGWGRTDSKQHFIELEEKNKKVHKKSWNSKSILPTLELGSEWEFLVTSKALDYSWTSQIDSAELELPVMNFRAEREGENGENLGWADVDFDDSDWKRVKIKDTFSHQTGCQRYLSSWDASWINYYDYTQHWGILGGAKVFFKRTLRLNKDVVSAFVCLTADRSYKLQINGKVVGEDDNWKSAESYEITTYLHEGENIITVEVSAAKGLLLQGLVKMIDGEQLKIYSDDGWEASLDKEIWLPAYKYIDPPQGTWGEVSFNGKEITFPATFWYRQVLPIGIKAIKLPSINGNYQLFVNGQKIEIPDGANRLNIVNMIQQGKNVLTVKVEANDFSNGILEPIVLVCRCEQVELDSWTKQGLDWYSGRGLYSKKITIPKIYLGDDKRLILSLGDVRFCAEIWVNSKLVTYRPWQPYTVDITDFVKVGENTITIVVANLKANQMYWDIYDAALTNLRSRWVHHGTVLRQPYRLLSGLIGPVKIVPYNKQILQVDMK